MALDSSVGAPVLFFVLLLVPASSPFLQKKETVCQSASDCGNQAKLACNSTGQRLAVLGVSRAYHLNISTFDQCASSAQNCSEIFEACCQPPESSTLCGEDYSTEFLEEVLSNCSAQLSPSGQDNNGTGCVLDLPSGPQPSVEICTQLSSYRNLSSYSEVDYACIPESDVAQLCQASTRQGNLLYAFWTPTQDSTLSRNDVNVTSCRCTVTTAGLPEDFFVRAVDVRIPQSDVPDECSNVTITDSFSSRLKTSCSNKTTILFGMTSQFTGLMSRPPVDLILNVHPKSEPATVWIGFHGLESKELILTCFNAGQNLSQAGPGTPEPTNTSGDSVSVPAVIGGVVAGVILLIIITFICFHFISKRKKRSFQSHTAGASSWWERTRQEDRLAEMSQLGPASSVITDNGRHMAYGRHPPTSRSFPTSDTNPPIHVVSGNAVPTDNSHSDFVAGDSWRRNSESEHHPGTCGVGDTAAAAAPSNMAAGWGGLGEPVVTYANVPQQDGMELDQQPVTIVSDGYKVRVYEVPPLTIKEIE